MDDNLPKVPQENGPTVQFDPPHSNPQDPNTYGPNSHYHQVQSELASHRHRDVHGHFLPEHPGQTPNSDSFRTNPSIPPPPSNPTQTTPFPNPPAESSSLPPPISIKEETKYSEKKDPPMLFILFTNPVTYFKKWVEKFLKNQDIDFHLRIRPFAAIGLIMTISIVGGGAFTIGRYFFPYSSPVFHRQVVYPGTIQKGDTNQFFLMTQDATSWKLKPKTNINLENLIGRQVLVTGNLTAEKYLIEVSELIITETPAQSLTYTQNIPTYQTPNASDSLVSSSGGSNPAPPGAGTTNSLLRT